LLSLLSGGIAELAWILQPSSQQAKEDVMKNSIGVLTATSILTLTLLSGCASKEPAASPQLTAVRQAIDQAQQADAQHYATREINTARSKLEAAEDAHEKGEEARASDLAEQAKLDAEYAAAVAQNEEAQNAVKALNDTLQTLRNELDNTTGNAAGAGASGASTSPASPASSGSPASPPPEAAGAGSPGGGSAGGANANESGSNIR
jgi:hypothetical protein